jgi:cytochrome c oxidase subunit 4
MSHAPAPAQPAPRHISARTYLIVFAWLAVMTVLEVAIASAPLPEPIKIGLLIGIAVVKAGLVILYYMHLRYDNPIYWVFLLVPVFFVILLTRYLILR